MKVWPQSLGHTFQRIGREGGPSGCSLEERPSVPEDRTETSVAMKSAEEVFRQERLDAVAKASPSTVFRATTVSQTLEQLRGDSGGCVVVVENEGERPKPIGIFTERDHLDKIASLSGEALLKVELSPIEQFMTAEPRSIPENETLEAAMQLMTHGGYRHLPMVDGGGFLVGLITARDIIHYLAESFPVEVMNLPPRLHQDERIQSREGG